MKKAADLTKEMLDSGAWETTEFKPYNFLVLGEKVGGGFLHPLMKVRAEFRKILMEMGFVEMPTNKWVESSFWNFDALYQPQQHPLSMQAQHQSSPLQLSRPSRPSRR